MRVTLATAVALCLAAFPAVAFGQILNGSFESGFTNWTTTIPGGHALGTGSGQGRTDLANAVNFNGGNLLGGASLAQGFATTSGQRYLLQFDYGVFGAAQNQQMFANVTGSGTLVNFTASGTGPAGTNDTTFTRYSIPFNANSAASTLTFTDNTTVAQSNSADGNLDRVSVTATPVTTLSPGGAGTVGTIRFQSGNLALAGTASQTDLSSGGVPSRGNDGNTNGNFGSGSVTHTASTTGAFWRVDLNPTTEEFAIDHVTIFNRTDCCQDRLVEFNVNALNSATGQNVLNPFDLGTTNSGNTNVDGVADLGSSGAQTYPQYGLRVVLPTNTIGDAVQVVQNGGAVLSLAEVQVAGLANLNTLPGDVAFFDIASGSSFDLITVAGTADIDDLAITPNLTSGFLPFVGQTFNLLTATSISANGVFINQPGSAHFTSSLVNGGNGQFLQLQVSAVAPEPSTIAMWSLLAFAAGGFAWKRSRRTR